MNKFWENNEGRRLEFKGELPAHSELAKTVVAFANDAGGDIYIGMNNDRQVTGLPEEELPKMEEQISNMVYDRCYRAIGLLPSSIDYSAMESRQSDARNKVIASVFKHLGIIDQWGNGLKVVAEEMKQYPEIELKWQEVGLSFQVQFIKKSKKRLDGGNLGGNGGNQSMEEQIMLLLSHNHRILIQEIADQIGISKRQCERVIAKLKKAGKIYRTGSSRTGEWAVNDSQ